MSGIVGLVNLDGSPIDRSLLLGLTESLAFRGPDAQQIWTDGPVGFGHAILRTTREAAHERQPRSLDGSVWITADARVDGRAELIQKLKSEGSEASAVAPDAELILRAYQVWGEDCLHHLIGDFAFALWDGRRRRLFCARDHFGVKPFFYARAGSSLILSNTLNCVRLHPGVSDELNELAIADFLLFWENKDPATTFFGGIKRLPAAHTLGWSQGEPRAQRYWTLPGDGRVRFQRPGDYVERFRELLDTATLDRLRTDRAGVLMSGGLDSPAVAAAAKGLLFQKRVAIDLQAFTGVYDRLIPDEERHYSGLVAQALGIPIHHFAADDYTLYQGLEQGELRTPEPQLDPLAAAWADQYRQVTPHCRVVLTGYGGDPALYPSQSYFFHLLKSLQVGRLILGLANYYREFRRIPPLGGVRGRLKRALGKHPPQPSYPPWLNPDFEARLDLRARWEQFQKQSAPARANCPEAYERVVSPFWSAVFESYDSGWISLPIEVRHPFFDLRLMSYLLAIPPIPWAWDKLLLREAMRGILPEAVRRRPKTPLAGDPVYELLQREESHWVDRFEPTAELAMYVDRGKIPPVGPEKDRAKIWQNLLPMNLNIWLRNRGVLKYKTQDRGDDEGTRPGTQQETLHESSTPGLW